MAVRAFVVSWVFAVILSGCGGSSGNQISGSPTPVPGSTPSPTPTPTPTATPTPTPSQFTPSRFIYTIVDFEADGGFFGGVINSSNGKVSPVPGTPTANALGQNIVIQVISDPQGRFLYSLNLGASSFGIQFGQIGIGGYKIDRSCGALSPIPNPIIFPAVRDQLMAIDGTGRFLYQPNTSGFDAYTIDQNSGVHRPGRCTGNAFDAKPGLLEQTIQDTPSESAVSPASLKRQIDENRRSLHDA